MKSNLALLDSAVSTTVAHELGEAVNESDLAGINPERHRHIAGLRVVSNAARDAATDENAAKLFRGLNAYRADAKVLTDKLSRVGVTSIAVLPLAAWDRLCDRTSLYRLNPNRDGQVRISPKALQDAESEAAKAKLKTFSPNWAGMVPVVLIPFLVLCVTRFGADPGFAMFIGLLGSVFGSLATAGVLSSIDANARTVRQQEILRANVDKATENGSICTMLWPNCREPAVRESNATIRIALPEPPTDVQQTLVAAERSGLPLLLAVVGDAITLRENPFDALMRHQKELDEAVRLRALLDPIVYVVEGSAVAVIAQYGDFPIEQEVIHEVVNSVYLA